MAEWEKQTIPGKTSKQNTRKKVRLATEIFEKYGEEIRTIIHFNTKDKSKADDIYQNFFVSIVHKPIPSEVQDVKAYLYRAVTNDVIDDSRQSKRNLDHIKKYAECFKHLTITEDPQSTAIRMENTKKMFQLIENRLPKREAKVVIQRYGQGLNTADTAEKMDVDNRIISRYLSSALKKMRKFIPEYMDDEL